MLSAAFLPSAIVKGLTQNIGTLCSTMQPWARADLLLGNKHGGEYSAKGSLNSRRIPSKTNSGAFKVVFQKLMAELKRPFTPQLLFRILNSSKFPRKKTRKVIINLQMMITIRHWPKASHSRWEVLLAESANFELEQKALKWPANSPHYNTNELKLTAYADAFTDPRDKHSITQHFYSAIQII